MSLGTIKAGNPGASAFTCVTPLLVGTPSACAGGKGVLMATGAAAAATGST